MAERPDDLNLPMSVVTRITKEALPDGCMISKEARLALSKAASVFVLYATSCANTVAQKSKRKTLTAPDVFTAMEEMEFETFLEPLKDSLEAYRSEQSTIKERKAAKRKEREDKEAEEKALQDTTMESSTLVTSELAQAVENGDEVVEDVVEEAVEAAEADQESVAEENVVEMAETIEWNLQIQKFYILPRPMTELQIIIRSQLVN